MKKSTVLFLLMIATLLGCKKGASTPQTDVPIPETSAVVESYSNVVVLGNSITRASPDTSIGWNNNWGMAATRPELDYLHLLTARLKLINPNVVVNSMPTGEFEVAYKTYDYTDYYAAIKASKPDLLILRFGENIVQDSPDLVYFDEKYAALIAYFKDGNPNLKILAAGSFWGNPVADKAMAKYSKFVTLTPLLNDINNQAFGIFPNNSVAIHPSDKGMLAICNIIWEGLKGL